jgi:translation elongation factor EF-Ts
MFSKDLEYSIGQCYKRAREARHEYMTVEHLLLALLDNPSAEAVLKAAGADVVGFTRLVVGEGIEKVVEDYAAEVAKAMQV